MHRHGKWIAWASLIALTGISVQAAHHSHEGIVRLAMTATVALIAWGKALVVIHAYLESPRAGKVFHRLVVGFAALAPLALLVSGIKEYLGGG